MMSDIPPALLLALFALVVLESIYLHNKKVSARPVIDFPRFLDSPCFLDSLSNVFIFFVGLLLKPLTILWSFMVFSLVESIQIFRFPDSAAMMILTFVVIDFAYYWYHRFNHQIKFLWALHHTHHSSMWMNLSVALRLNWVAQFIAPIGFSPLIVLGCSPELLTAFLLFNLFFQFFLHNQYIGKLGWFEGKLLNTPSAHRVHHGSNDLYVDKNYGGVLIVWDRFFGTYQPEIEQVEYGVRSGLVGFNPFKIQFIGIIQWGKNRLLLEKWNNRLKLD